MCERTGRKRILRSTKGIPVIADEDAYSQNKASERARKINTINPDIKFNIWHDQHYQIRKQFGDEAGERIGIDSIIVESLVQRLMSHLVCYSTILKNFNFVNFSNPESRAIRVVLQEETKEEMLNVVIEVHFIDITTFEVTIKTAMCSDSFRLSDGQFAIELIQNESVLKRMEKGNVIEIYSL